MPTFNELFSGGGCARLGLGDAWTPLFANDISAAKVASYRANFGCGEVRLEDIRDLEASDLPKADLWWASFPCQDHSAAGRGLGFTGQRGSLVFQVTRLLDGARLNGTAPKIVAMENVTGFLNAFESEDFASLVTALVSAGYRPGAVMMNARDFLPQSRERVILVAVREDIVPAEALMATKPVEPWHTKALQRAVDRLPAYVERQWIWWQMPLPPKHGLSFVDLMDDLTDVTSPPQFSEERTAEVLAKLTGQDAVRLGKARWLNGKVVGTIMGSHRETEAGRTRGYSLRTDGIVGCLTCRTKDGRQQVMVIDGGSTFIRDFSARELAKLMGLPSYYRLPDSYHDSVRLTGDGLAVPVVRWLARHLLEPLLEEVPVGGGLAKVKADVQARARAARVRKESLTPGAPTQGGMKRDTTATTAYFLPDEAARLHAVAAELGISFHEMLIKALDGLLARRGEQPVRRYKKKK